MDRYKTIISKFKTKPKQIIINNLKLKNMKTTNLKQSVIAIVLFVMLFLTYTIATAQTFQLEAKLKVKKHRYLKECTVEILNLSTGAVTIKPATKVLLAELEYHQEYTIVISKDGYEPKSIYINTNCNLNQSFWYTCSIKLRKKEMDDDIPYQAGRIFYNDNKGEFDYCLTKN